MSILVRESFENLEIFAQYISRCEDDRNVAWVFEAFLHKEVYYLCQSNFCFVNLRFDIEKDTSALQFEIKHYRSAIHPTGDAYPQINYSRDLSTETEIKQT